MISKLLCCRPGAILGGSRQSYAWRYRAVSPTIRRRFANSAVEDGLVGNAKFNAFSDLILPEPPVIDPGVIVNVLTEPTFASLGLNNYTPCGLVQSILENVHIYLSLPWWACIGITAVLLRTCMLPVMLSQRRVLATYQNAMASMIGILGEVSKAKKSGDSISMLIKMKEFSNIIEKNDLRMMAIIKPILIQGPVFITVFMALRGMANAPVSSLQTGGLSWFTDLTIYDPYYILPLITAASMAYIIETGAETPTPTSPNMIWLFRCIPVVSFLIICHFPSTLLLYWTCSNIYSLVFASIMKIPNIQKALKIPDIIKQSHVDVKVGMKEVMEIMQSLQEIEMRNRAEEKRWQKNKQNEVLQEGLAAATIRKKMKKDIEFKKLDDIDNNRMKE